MGKYETNTQIKNKNKEQNINIINSDNICILILKILFEFTKVPQYNPKGDDIWALI